MNTEIIENEVIVPQEQDSPTWAEAIQNRRNAIFQKEKNNFQVFKNGKEYIVKNIKKGSEYTVSRPNGKVICDCVDYLKNGDKIADFRCKHILAVFDFAKNGKVEEINKEDKAMNTSLVPVSKDIIDIEPAIITSTIERILNFQTLIKKTFKDGIDYGIIPGCRKPSLLKPGAEKILMLAGVASEYELLEKIQDYEGKGFFSYTVKCKLSKNGMVITEGFGSCNTREKKYINQDPYTLSNTCLKMGKKRAQVDACLTLASLSDIFTQDIEDMDRPSGTGGNGKYKGQEIDFNKIGNRW